MSNDSRDTIHEIRFTRYDSPVRNNEMSVCTKIGSFLGFLAAGILSLFGKSLPKPTAEDLKRTEFKTSTQRLGIRFTEKIRDVFRFRWLR